jgi:hypothetical protein
VGARIALADRVGEQRRREVMARADVRGEDQDPYRQLSGQDTEPADA